MTRQHSLLKPIKQKDFAYGKIEQLSRRIPEIHEIRFQIDVIKTGTPQRIISNSDVPDGARMLNEVVVKGRRVEMERPLDRMATLTALLKEMT
ncbi:MAG: hypothetical protein IPJ20_20850 [Flammeovirgaceae bacterium]|nr:hypothetical protein [Flammeovirgaceae bacterium]